MVCCLYACNIWYQAKETGALPGLWCGQLEPSCLNHHALPPGCASVGGQALSQAQVGFSIHGCWGAAVYTLTVENRLQPTTQSRDIPGLMQGDIFSSALKIALLVQNFAALGAGMVVQQADTLLVAAAFQMGASLSSSCSLLTHRPAHSPRRATREPADGRSVLVSLPLCNTSK